MMANYRTLPSSVVLALVGGALVLAIGARAKFINFNNNRQLDQLGDGILVNEKIEYILRSVDEPQKVKAGALIVQDILDRAGRNDLSVEACIKNGIVEHNMFTGQRDRIIAENVHKFLYQDLFAYCAKNIGKVFDKVMKGGDNGIFVLQSLYDPECTPLERARKLVDSIELLSEEPLSEPFFMLAYNRNLRDLQIRCYDKNIFLQAEDLMKAKLHKGASTDELYPELKRLGEPLLKNELIGDILRSVDVGDRMRIKAAGLSVLQILDDSDREDFSLKDCFEKGIVRHNPFASIRDKNVAENVHKFRYQYMFEFCADNIEQVFQKSMEPGDAPLGSIPNPVDNECSRIERTNELIDSIQSLSDKQLSPSFKQFIETNFKTKFVECRLKGPFGLFRMLNF